MGFHVDLRAGVGSLLDTAAVVLWQPSGAIPAAPARPPLYDTAIPETAPSLAAAIASYDGVELEPGQAESEARIQVRCRSTADPRPGQDLADSVAGVLLGRYPVTLPSGVRILTLEQTSGSAMGRDDSGRWDYVINFRLLCYRPTTYRR